MPVIFDRLIVSYMGRQAVLHPYELLEDVSFLVNGGIPVERCVAMNDRSIQGLIEKLPFAVPSKAEVRVNGRRATWETLWEPGDRIEFRKRKKPRRPVCDAPVDEVGTSAGGGGDDNGDSPPAAARAKIGEVCHSETEDPPEPYRSVGHIDGTKRYLASLLHPNRLQDKRHLDRKAKIGTVWLQRSPEHGYRIWFNNLANYRRAFERKQEDERQQGDECEGG